MELAYCDNFCERNNFVPWVGAENGLNIKLRYQVAWLRHLPDLVSHKNKFRPEILQSNICSSKGIYTEYDSPGLKCPEKLYHFISEIQGGYKDGSDWTKCFLK